MTTQTLRTVGQYQLICAGLGASGLFNIFDSELLISTDWDDSQFKDSMMALDSDDFEAECEALIEAEIEQGDYTACDGCEALTEDPVYSTGGSRDDTRGEVFPDALYCSYDCREHRTYG